MGDRDEPQRVLITDDDPIFRMLVHATLSGLGYEMLEAGDGQAALDIVRRFAVDVVVLDVDMPGMDGRAVCARLKQPTGPSGWAPFVVMLTGTEAPPVWEEGGLAADVWLTKPFSPRRLLDVVDDLCARARGYGQPGPSPHAA